MCGREDDWGEIWWREWRGGREGKQGRGCNKEEENRRRGDDRRVKYMIGRRGRRETEGKKGGGVKRKGKSKRVD